ncbi:hypothetical protein E2K71_26525 [Escherichia coli]|nr:hypothetical protein E2K71_26525 [Escherichia coli]
MLIISYGAYFLYGFNLAKKITAVRKFYLNLLRVVTSPHSLNPPLSGFFCTRNSVAIQKAHGKRRKAIIYNKILKIALYTISFVNIVYFEYCRITL